jgi:hypothetical protein
MIICPTSAAASATPEVAHVHRIDDAHWAAFVEGDELPFFLTDGVIDEKRTPEQLQAIADWKKFAIAQD